jgi:predicted peroxiredoxin
MGAIRKHLMLSLSVVFCAEVSVATNLPEVATEDKTQDVVITLQQDPLRNLEASCVAIQIGISQLAMGSEVTLFPTLAGVRVVNNEVLELLNPNDYADRPAWGHGHAFGLHKGKDAEPELCLVGAPDGSIVMMPLRDLLDGFVDAGGKIVVCPLCWYSRYPATLEDSDLLGELLYAPAVMGSPAIIPTLFNDANKVIDY